MPVLPHPVAVEAVSRETDWVWRRGVGVIPIVLAFVGGLARCGRQRIVVAVLPEIGGGQGTLDLLANEAAGVWWLRGGFPHHGNGNSGGWFDCEYCIMTMFIWMLAAGGRCQYSPVCHILQFRI